jgi:hypothetical protein
MQHLYRGIIIVLVLQFPVKTTRLTAGGVVNGRWGGGTTGSPSLW